MVDGLVPTDFVIFPSIITLTVWTVRSIFTMSGQLDRINDKLDNKLEVAEYYKERLENEKGNNSRVNNSDGDNRISNSPLV